MLAIFPLDRQRKLDLKKVKGQNTTNNLERMKKSDNKMPLILPTRTHFYKRLRQSVKIKTLK